MVHGRIGCRDAWVHKYGACLLLMCSPIMAGALTRLVVAGIPVEGVRAGLVLEEPRESKKMAIQSVGRTGALLNNY